MTFLGKLLVYMTVLCSFVFLALAAAVYLISPDWGWDVKHARKEFGQPIPSEIEKRKPIVSELARVKSRARAAWEEASKKLATIETEIPENQLLYSDELARIDTGEPQDLKALQKSKPWLFENDPKTGKPPFQFGGIDNTYDGYLRQLNQLLGQIKKTRDEVNLVIKDEQDLTEQLNGKMDAMGKQEKGLYALIGLEEEVRKRAQEELEDLRPSYFEELALSQLLLKRQASLRARVEELKTTQKDKPQE
jgi:hypothetical protein